MLSLRILLIYVLVGLIQLISWTSSFKSLHLSYTKQHSTRLSCWSDQNVPADYRGVEEKMVSSLSDYLSDIRDRSDKRLSVDLLTPGLNPRLEQKAMLFQDLLFDLIIAMFPPVSLQFRNTLFAFPSSGDAAGFQNYCGRKRILIPDSITLSDLAIYRVNTFTDCVVFINAKNNRGDPVIKECEKICTQYSDATYIFLNCDLSDAVTTGMVPTRFNLFQCFLHTSIHTIVP